MEQNDILSPVAREVLRFNAASAYTQLVPERGGADDVKTLLQTLKSDGVLNRFTSNRNDGDAMVAGLWLWHDFLDESHERSQNIETPNGSFWHAIMHRREGDFSNSKYWLARCANHPIYPSLAVRADDIIRPYPADKSVFRITGQGWNPSAFVDLVEAVNGKPEDPRHRVAVALQQLEWRLLFDHCMRGAGGD